MNMILADAVALPKISDITQVDEALGEAHTYGRFATSDLASLLGERSIGSDPECKDYFSVGGFECTAP